MCRSTTCSTAPSSTAAGFTLSGFQRAYSANGIGELITNSLLFAIGASALSLVVGTALAYLNVRTDVPFKPLFFAASVIPLIIPGILYTVAWIFLASPNIGLLNKILEPVFGPGFLDVFTLWDKVATNATKTEPEHALQSKDAAANGRNEINKEIVNLLSRQQRDHRRGAEEPDRGFGGASRLQIGEGRAA